MDLVSGALGSVVPKLLQLLQDEYRLQRGVRAEVESLSRELESIHLALCKVAQVRHGQLDPQVRLWARDVREASYDMEDVLDSFLVRVDGGEQPAANVDKGKFERLREKMAKLFSLSKLKARHGIASAIDDIKKQVEEMARRRDRYKVDNHMTIPVAPTIDPRLSTLYTKASGLVGISEPRDVLIKMLCQGDDTSEKRMKIVSIVGPGGLGKTTLAKIVYEKLIEDMGICYNAFVPVGQNPDLKKVFRDILVELDHKHYMPQIHNLTILDERQIINEFQSFIKNKRYLIIIDDIWDVPLWNIIRNALDDNNLGSKVIITTRCNDVAKKVCCSYKMEPLCLESSKILFHSRIFESEDKCPEKLSELSKSILKKCGGVPLAIITTASLLANTSQDITEWQEIHDAIGSGLSSSDDMCNMREILSLSYYHLPSNVKTCLLYLSIYPEDYEITRNRLIWRWIAEGFVQPEKNGDDLFELGEGYFNELINRSLIQPIRHIDSDGVTYGCRVHDMILDLICSLARDENFVTVLKDDEKNTSSRSKYRRLSLKNTSWPEIGVSQVRSIAIFAPSIHSMKPFSCFSVLRILDLEGCRFEKSGGHLNVGNLIHLRYLGLTGTKLHKLPRGIEKLQLLEVLKPGGCYLPPAIFGLRRLMCLERGPLCPRPGNLLGNLASLHVLKSLIIDHEDSAIAVEELGHLTQLKELHMDLKLEMDQNLCDAFINSLCNLRKLQTLQVVHRKNKIMKWYAWTPSTHLRTLTMFEHLPTMPKWISPTHLPHLSVLLLEQIVTVQTEDIQILGTLPALCRLGLDAYDWSAQSRLVLKSVVVNADAFPSARWCNFKTFTIVPSMFPQGAMPMVESLRFCLKVSDFFSRAKPQVFNFDDLAMGHLRSLKRVDVTLHQNSELFLSEQTIIKNRQELMEMKHALRHAADVHPKHPSIRIIVY